VVRTRRSRGWSEAAPEDLGRLRQLLAAQLLHSRSLHSLVVSGAGVPGPASLRIRALSAGAARIEHGHPPLRVTADGPAVVLVYEGRLEGPILALAQFEPSADARYEIEIVAGDRVLRRTLYGAQVEPFDSKRTLATTGDLAVGAEVDNGTGRRSGVTHPARYGPPVAIQQGQGVDEGILAMHLGQQPFQLRELTRCHGLGERDGDGLGSTKTLPAKLVLQVVGLDGAHHLAGSRINGILQLNLTGILIRNEVGLDNCFQESAPIRSG